MKVFIAEIILRPLQIIGVSSFFNYVSFKNNQVINQKFTESEIETLKSIANEVIKSEETESLNNSGEFIVKTNQNEKKKM